MKKSQIYTRTGDKGDTGLVSGTRTSKADPRIDMYGEMDELNSRLGVVVAHLRQLARFPELVELLEKIQSSLFDLGANLACEADKRNDWKLPQITTAHIQLLESRIDAMDGELPALKNFILPGGHPIAAEVHLCRTCARSVEREMVAFRNASGEALPELSLEYVNRLSDYFFVLARWVNKQFGGAETPWKPS